MSKYPSFTSFLDDCLPSSFYIGKVKSMCILSVLPDYFSLLSPFPLFFPTISYPDQMEREKVTGKNYHFVPCLAQLFVAWGHAWSC